MDGPSENPNARSATLDWAYATIVCAGIVLFELQYGHTNIKWARLTPLSWAFLATTLALVLVGTYRLRRGDATPSPVIEPSSTPPGQLAFLGALGVSLFILLYNYLFSLPYWLARSVQWLLKTLGATNQGSFVAEQDGIRFAAGLAAQLAIVGILLLLNRQAPGLVRTQPLSLIHI